MPYFPPNVGGGGVGGSGTGTMTDPEVAQRARTAGYYSIWPNDDWPNEAYKLWFLHFGAGGLTLAAAIVVTALTATGVFDLDARFSTFAPNDAIVPLPTNAQQKFIGTAQVGWFFAVALYWQALAHMMILFRRNNFFLGQYYFEGVNQRYNPYKFVIGAGTWSFVSIAIAMILGITDILFLVAIFFVTLVAWHSFMIALETIFYEQTRVWQNLITVARNETIDEAKHRISVEHGTATNVELNRRGEAFPSNNGIVERSIKEFSLHVSKFLQAARWAQGSLPFTLKSVLESEQDLHAAYASYEGARLLPPSAEKDNIYKNAIIHLARVVNNLLVPKTALEHGALLGLLLVVINVTWYGLALATDSNGYSWWVHLGMWSFLVTIWFHFVSSMAYWFEWGTSWLTQSGRLGVYVFHHIHFAVQSIVPVFITFIVLGGGHNRGLLY